MVLGVLADTLNSFQCMPLISCNNSVEYYAFMCPKSHAVFKNFIFKTFPLLYSTENLLTCYTIAHADCMTCIDMCGAGTTIVYTHTCCELHTSPQLVPAASMVSVPVLWWWLIWTAATIPCRFRHISCFSLLPILALPPLHFFITPTAV